MIKIFVEQQREISPKAIMDDLARLDAAITENRKPQELIALLREMIPTYHDPKEVNGRVAPSEVLEPGKEQVNPEAYPSEAKELVPGVG